MPNGVRVDASDLRKVAKIAKEFDPALRKALIKQLRAAGAIGAADVKEAIHEMPSQGKDDRSLRDLIAKAVTVNVATTGKRADIRIRVRKTPALQAIGAGGIAKAINKGRWRHPLFGNRDHWYTQTGYEFFDNRIERHREEMRALVKTALDEARDIALAKGRLL